jgi:hypothetical protein
MYRELVSCGLRQVSRDCGSSNITCFRGPLLQGPDFQANSPATICRGAARKRLSSLRFLVLNQLPGYPLPAIFAATGFCIFDSTARGTRNKKGQKHGEQQ